MKSHCQIAGIASLLLVTGVTALQAGAGESVSGPLAGTWTLVAADVIHSNGTRSGDYGAAPKGLLMIDAQGRYSLQIYSTERPRFASGDKQKGSPAEYAAAILGASTHFGTISVDPAAHIFTLNVEHSTYPNQEGIPQKRTYELSRDLLSYRVATRPNGDTPVSVWRKLN
jgi:hypothetical protein